MTNSLKVIANPKRHQAVYYCLVFLCVLGFSNTVAAHFEHPLARVIHVVEEDQGLRIYGRMPLALVLLPETWQGINGGQRLSYVRTIKEGSDWRYYLDKNAIDERPGDLGNQIVGSIHFRRDLARANETVGLFEQLVVHAYLNRPAFNTLAKAKNVFNTGPTSNAAPTPFGVSQLNAADAEHDLEIFDAVVDVQYFIPGGQLRSLLSLESQLGDHLPILDKVLNIVLFHFPEGIVTLTSQGLLSSTLDRENDSRGLREFINHVYSGMTHILLGFDHVLFILLLIVAASNWIDIARKATAFTLAHSATLGLGLLGYSPSLPWFIPFVETAIAVSIIYAGVLIVAGNRRKFTVPAIALIGLLHGFGFSFAVNELVLEQGAIHLPSLLAFCLGIEVGQLLILLFVGPLLYQANKIWNNNTSLLRQSISMPCILLALFWMVERGSDTFSAFTKPVSFEVSGPVNPSRQSTVSAMATDRLEAKLFN